MATKRRFSWMRQFMRPKGEVKVEISIGGVKLVPGSWKRPYCTKCGKKIRDIKKLVYDDGKPYHKRCYSDEGRSENNQSTED